MNVVMNSRRLIVAALGVSLMAGACERTSDRERTATEAERTAENARQEARRAEAEAAEAARRAEAERRAEADRQAEAARRAENTPMGQVPSATARLALNDALSNIASARCEREQRCNNIGAGRRYESVQACRTVVQNDFSDDLNPRECASVDHHELNECMAEIRGEDCNNPIDTLQRVAACRTSDICRATTVSMR